MGKFLTEIPDFGGDSLRNHPEPKEYFRNLRRARGDFCESPAKLGIFTKTAGPSVAHGWHVHELKNQVLKIFGGTQKN